MKRSRIPVAIKHIKGGIRREHPSKIIAPVLDNFKGMQRRLHQKVVNIAAQNADILSAILRAKNEIQNVHDGIQKLEEQKDFLEKQEILKNSLHCDEMNSMDFKLQKEMYQDKVEDNVYNFRHSVCDKPSSLSNDTSDSFYIQYEEENVENGLEPFEPLTDSDIDMENCQLLENLNISSSQCPDEIVKETKGTRNNVFDWLEKLPSDSPMENVFTKNNHAIRSPPLLKLSNKIEQCNDDDDSDSNWIVYPKNYSSSSISPDDDDGSARMSEITSNDSTSSSTTDLISI